MRRFPLHEHKPSPATAVNLKEKRILTMLDCGLSREEIGKHLGMTYSAVSGYIDRIRQRERKAAT